MAGFLWVLALVARRVHRHAVPRAHRGLATAAALLLAGAAGTEAQPARETTGVWAFRKPIVLPPLAKPGFVEVRLDADVVREEAPTLADLRVRDVHGTDVGYAVRRRERAGAETARESTMLNLVTTPEGAMRFVLDAGTGRIPHDRVRLTVREQARAFRVPVRVETAKDGRTWQLARESGFIYRVEGETQAADTSIASPPSTARWLRVTVGPERGRAVPLAGAALVSATPREREEERVAAAVVDRDEEPSATTPRYDVTSTLEHLGGKRLPEATLGSVQRAPGPTPAPWLSSQPLVKWASTTMAALALGSLLWRMARAVRAGG